jgi:hypothetical protein
MDESDLLIISDWLAGYLHFKGKHVAQIAAKLAHKD